MKKLAILLSLVMVLGLAVNASAAATVTGEVEMRITNDDEVSFMDSYNVSNVKVNYVATVNDNLKVTIQTNLTNETKEDKTILQNHWLDYKVGNVTVKAGKFRTTSGDSVGTLAKTVTGVGATMSFDGGAVSAVWNPVDGDNADLFVFNGKYAPLAGLTVFGDVIIDTVKDTTAYAVAADYEVGGFTVYGNYGKDADDKDIMNVGVTTTVSAFDLTFDYDVEGEAWEFNVETVYNGLTLGADVADGSISGYLKVKF